MPLFLAPTLTWLAGSKLGHYLLIAVASVAALGAAYLYIYHQGASSERARIEAATAAESARREKVIAYWEKWAEGATAKLNGLKAKNDERKNTIAAASAKDDNSPCLDAGAVDRLSGFGRDASKGTEAR